MRGRRWLERLEHSAIITLSPELKIEQQDQRTSSARRSEDLAMAETQDLQTKSKKLKLKTDIPVKAELRMKEPLAIGCCIRSSDYSKTGTVGPFVRLIKTDELCFLTARNIFGPPQVFLDKKVVGTKVLHILCDGSRGDKGAVCGTVVATELTEMLDVVLVKITDECKPTTGKFITATDEQLRKAGFAIFEVPSYNNDSMQQDARDLTQTEIEDYRVIKVGGCTGLTVGDLKLTPNKNTDDYIIKKENTDMQRLEFLPYKEHMCITDKDDKFAEDRDVGSAVYLVDKHNQMHCIGMIVQVLHDDDESKVLVTPIQGILRRLGEILGQTVELATFEDKAYQFDSPYDKEIFHKALEEGYEKDRQIRINIVGYYNEGKTSLTRRLLNESVEEVLSTDLIEVHVRRCKLKEGGVWETCERDEAALDCVTRFTDVLKETPQHRLSSPFPEDEIKMATLKEYGEEVLDKSESEIEGNITIGTTDNTNSALRDQHGLFHTSGKGNILATNAVQKTNFIRRVTDTLASPSTTDTTDVLWANIWDFGGQFIYYATHQIFHSRDAIYLLVFDLTKKLDGFVIDVDFPRKEKIENNLRFWVNSIHAFAGSEDGKTPIIILIGTHKDKFEGNEREMAERFEEIENLFADSVLGNHIHEKHFAVDNLHETDGTIDELRKTIFELGSDIARKMKVPAKWIPLEDALLNAKDRNILKFEEIRVLNSANNEPIGTDDDLKLFLKYHHGKGMLVFFDEDVLSDYVIINPQYLIDAFKCIITSRKTCRMSVDLQEKWQLMTKDGVVEKRFVEEIWQQNTNGKFFENRHILLLFLQRHRILAELKQMDDSTGEQIGLGKYLIPCLLQKQRKQGKVEKFLKGKKRTEVAIGFHIKHTIVIPIIYERVTAALLGKWSPIHFEDEALIFQNVGYFKIDPQHAGRIELNQKKGIEVMVISLCPPPYTPQPVECDRFRRYVDQVIQHEFRKLHHEKKRDTFIYRVKCSDPSHDLLESNKWLDLEEFKNLPRTTSCLEHGNHTLSVEEAVATWFLKQEYPTARKFEDRVVTERELSQLAQAIGANWELLGVELGLTSDEIQRIRIDHEHSGIATVIFFILKQWKQINSGKDTLGNLTNKIFTCQGVNINTDKIRNVMDNF